MRYIKKTLVPKQKDGFGFMRNIDPIEQASRFELAELPLMFNGRLANTPFVSEHKHEFDEIVLVVAGHGIHHTPYGEQQFDAGDVLVIPEGESHAYCDCGSMIIYNCLVRMRQLPLPLGELYHHPAFARLFLGNAKQFQAQRGFPRVRLDDADLAKAEEIMIHCNRESSDRKLGWSLNCYGGFLEYLTLLLRHYQGSANASGTIALRISECLALLNANPFKNVSVPWLCRKVGMSESTLLRNFKLATGMSIREYRIALRLAKASQLLCNDSKLPIGELALQCGFTDSNYFARLFRVHFHCTPSAFRNRERTGQGNESRIPINIVP